MIGWKSFTVSYAIVLKRHGTTKNWNATTQRGDPSGGDLATNSPPISVLPPGLLSTTAGWPQASVNFAARMRPSVSLKPPGGYGTTILIGLVGYWARTEDAKANSSAASNDLDISGTL